MTDLFSWLLEIDQHLAELVNHYGAWTYIILFAIVFCETGIVIMPLLPGDSLLFAAGSVASLDDAQLNPVILWATLIVAAVLGDTVNYHIGKFLGPKVLRSETSRWLNKRHLAETQHFFEKYGNFTIVIARFLPIVRTFAPFVAGVGSMNYGRFLLYNIAGGVLWVTLCVWAGYFFGRIPFVQDNFGLVILVIIGMSLIPVCIAWWQSCRARNANAAANSAP